MTKLKEQTVVPVALEMLQRLNKDVKDSVTNLSRAEARKLVDLYYQMQDFRIATQGQVRSVIQNDKDEPCETLKWFEKGFETLEGDIKKVLDIYTDNDPIGRWCKSITGIGPVIAAGLIANLDVKDKPTAGHFWSYVGHNDYNRPWLGSAKTTEIVNAVLEGKKNKDITYEDFCKCCIKAQWNPKNVINVKTPKGESVFIKDGEYIFKKDDIIKQLSKRPYNNRMKVLVWKLGESFVKVANNPKDFYGKLYAERKAYESAKNENLEYKEQADIKAKKVGKNTEAYKWYSKGMLPPAHIYARAKRWATRIFLSHLHQVMYMYEYGQMPPKPFAIEHLGHAHEIKCPNLDLIKEYI